jgi:predicted nucleic acid-binding protein
VYLVDTNVWLEVLLGQEESETAEQMLRAVDSHLLLLTDQYVAASQNNLEIVSLDSDFDATDLGRLHPREVLERTE